MRSLSGTEVYRLPGFLLVTFVCSRTWLVPKQVPSNSKYHVRWDSELCRL